MKKRIITAIMVITLSLSAISFSSVKAATEVTTLQTNSRIEYNGNLVGYYLTYSANVNPSSDYLDLSIYGVVNTDDYFKTATWVEIRFTQYCSGYIYVNYSGNMNSYTYNVPVGDGVGRYTYSAANKRMAIYFENCNHIVVYNFSPTYQTTPTAQVSSITVQQYSAGGSGGGTSIAPFADYNIPAYSIMAYYFPQYNSSVLMDDGAVYPYIHIENGTVSKTLEFSDYKLFIFIADNNFQPGEYHASALSANSNVSIERINNGIGSSLGSAQIYIMHFTTTIQNAIAEITWDEEFNMIPIYLGIQDFIPMDLVPLTGYGYTMATAMAEFVNMTDVLQQILDALTTNDDPVDERFEDTTDVIQDLTDQEDQVIGDFKNDIDDFNNNIDLDDYDFLQDISNTSEYFKMMLDETFNKSVQVRAFWVIPVICVVIIRLLGQ